ncbi:MAG TPA: hypothetical protein VLA09_07205, partial [Longimicrobiales bacterium]|nr:hypothetical protein [Longimicrobiales bacterium]
MRRWVTSFLGLATVACGGQDPSPTTISADEIGEHTRVLASDAFLGRGPGQAGGDAAAQYIADRFAEYGLEAPRGSYFQRMSMVGNTPDPQTAALSFSGPGGSFTSNYLDDFVLNPGNAEATSVSGEAELVFVGYGIDAPEAGWNDFADVDVAGKFILILVNDPPGTGAEPRRFGGIAMTYYGRWTYKY